MKTKYRHLFFDLDRTLWDFDKSSELAFSEIFLRYNLEERGIESVKAFQSAYNFRNEEMWALYREGKIEKEVMRNLRFNLTLNDFGISDPNLANSIGNDYLEISPRKVSLFPNAISVLEYLKPKYKLHLITNGFSEVQFIKINVSGLGQFFEEVITSEKAGYKKPDPAIFYYALNETGANPEESLMIGDDPLVDIEGAKNAGIDQVLFDPLQVFEKNGSTFYINHLDELNGFL